MLFHTVGGAESSAGLSVIARLQICSHTMSSCSWTTHILLRLSGGGGDLPDSRLVGEGAVEKAKDKTRKQALRKQRAERKARRSIRNQVRRC